MLAFSYCNMQPQSSSLVLDKSKKCLIVFILGGIVQSEMRCAYEVSKELNCEVFIGGRCFPPSPCNSAPLVCHSSIGFVLMVVLGAVFAFTGDAGGTNILTPGQVLKQLKE